ncbi:MAG: HlyD family secretion protein [Phycisphaeraceae bacterium]|nr:HlyD family secretion protein [Phycisphaeraceae bacterium]
MADESAREPTSVATSSGPQVDGDRPVNAPTRKTGPHLIFRLALIVTAIAAAILLTPWVRRMLHTVSTDDAYVNGHVTFVAPRVPGQVSRVLVEDNNRVKKGDLLVELDKTPYQLQVDISGAALGTAKANLVAAIAAARGIEGQMRSLRFALERSIESVNDRIELLKAKAATLDAQKAQMTLAQSDYERALKTGDSGGLSQEEIDHRKQAVQVAQAKVAEALQNVHEIRASLGLSVQPEQGRPLTDVPANLDQTFSAVREAQAQLIQVAAQMGIVSSFEHSPREMLADFKKRAPDGNIDTIYNELLMQAPSVKQAEARVLEAQRQLEQAKLNLSYCDVIAEIDGVVTRRNVNPGNNVVVGQSLMAVRSLTEIWVDANFKETQLSYLRIGQTATLDVDMYGDTHRFKGRITGFTMGTGSTLALLPAENATGNFVKVVQRLPVRIELIDYDPEEFPLFVGLSVTPTVFIDQPATGPDAGRVLQPSIQTPLPEGRGAGVESAK